MTPFMFDPPTPKPTAADTLDRLLATEGRKLSVRTLTLLLLETLKPNHAQSVTAAHELAAKLAKGTAVDELEAMAQALTAAKAELAAVHAQISELRCALPTMEADVIASSIVTRLESNAKRRTDLRKSPREVVEQYIEQWKQIGWRAARIEEKKR